MITTKDELGTEDNQIHRCANCDSLWLGRDLVDVSDLTERIEPGGTVPGGECPLPDKTSTVNRCGCLCYPTNHKKFPRGVSGICPTHGVYALKTPTTPCPKCEDKAVEAEIEEAKL
jgi:hypothetical protein